MSEVSKRVIDVTVENEDGTNYVCFVFPVEPGKDQDGLQFQWADDEANAKELYVEMGGQGNGSYGSVTAVSLRERHVVINLAPSSRQPFSSIQLECADIAPALLAEAVAKLNAVLTP